MATLFSDNFNTGSDPSGTNWTQDPGANWQLVSGAVQYDGNASGVGLLLTTSAAHAAIANCKVSVKQANGSTFSGGPVVRVNAADDTLYELGVSGTDTVELYRVIAGSATLLATRTVAHTTGDVLTLEVSGTGATVTLKAYKNGVQMGADVTDSSGSRITAAGKTGILGVDGPVSLFDDFLVEDLTVGGASITGTGAITSSRATLAGSGVRGHTATGNPTITRPSVAATANKNIFGTGALTNPQTTISASTGSGATKTGAGALTAAAIVTAGVGPRGVQDMPGTIAISYSGVPLVAGVGTIGQGQEGLGALTIARATLAGVAAKGRAAASVTLTSSRATVAGTAFIGRVITGTGALTSPNCLVNGVASFGHTGTGVITSPKAQITGAGLGGTTPAGSSGFITNTRVPTTQRAVRYAHGRPSSWRR